MQLQLKHYFLGIVIINIFLVIYYSSLNEREKGKTNQDQHLKPPSTYISNVCQVPSCHKLNKMNLINKKLFIYYLKLTDLE